MSSYPLSSPPLSLVTVPDMRQQKTAARHEQPFRQEITSSPGTHHIQNRWKYYPSPHFPSNKCSVIGTIQVRLNFNLGYDPDEVIEEIGESFLAALVTQAHQKDTFHCGSRHLRYSQWLGRVKTGASLVCWSPFIAFTCICVKNRLSVNTAPRTSRSRTSAPMKST